MVKYEIRDQFDNILDVIRASNKEEARKIAKKKWAGHLRVIKKDTIKK